MSTYYAVIKFGIRPSLEWIGTAPDDAEAFEKFCASIGVTDPVEEDEVLDTVNTVPLSAEEARQVESWFKSGQKGFGPDCIVDYLARSA